MKRRVLAVLMAAALCVGVLAGCGKDGGSGAASGDLTEIKGFNEDYYPDLDAIEKKQGKIDVVILFEGAQKGWEAMAKEYEKIHGGQVTVVLNQDYSSGTYAEALKYQIQDANTDWDIVMGNYAGDLINTYGINMYSNINDVNPYAGGEIWRNVLQEDAYITDKSGANTSTYIMNSENLWTSWFVNKEAMKAAGEQGYKNANGEVANPVTWQDLINLCEGMKKAGYTNPLGLSVSPSSVQADHFSWLLRVYGDYYYRNEYDGIMNASSEFKLDPQDQNPESNLEYAVDVTKLFGKILDQNASNYVGANSAKYKEFLANMGQMKPYLNAIDAKGKTMTDMRNDFQYQTNGKDSPQIMLDYLGKGLQFLTSDKIDVDFFDYPTMESKGGFVPKDMLTRDVGGNGGYLSIINHKAAQNELNLDFIKFVMSPYGQSIYYDALSKTEFSPQGLTLVRQDLVVVPDAWVDFFATDAITFTGLSDSSEFVRNLMVGCAGGNIKGDLTELWQNYLVGTGGDAITADTFATKWAGLCQGAWTEYAQKNNWNVNCYKYPGNGTSYGGE